MSLAEKLAIRVAEGKNAMTGGPVGIRVVKALSVLNVVPCVLLVTIRKW
jgi:hypothetical protein